MLLLLLVIVVQVGWIDNDSREHNNSVVSYMMVD